MVMDKLGGSLQDALRKLVGAGRIDEKAVDELVRDIQRALLQADVNVKLVMALSQTIKQRSLKEKPPGGMSPREHVIRIVYQELINILGKDANVKLAPQTIARYFQRKGLKTAVICADNFRHGAYDQLKKLCEKTDVFFYGEKDEKDAVGITKRGLRAIEKYDVKIIDTAGRHALESDLIKEMEEIHRAANPDHKFLVLDAAIGQLASEQARVFNNSVGITGVVITKLDGTAKGGGALSAVSETDSAIAFIGTGETPDDIERFEPDRFISRLLGMGDIRALVEKAEEALKPDDFDVGAMMSGRFSLKDMYNQLEAMNKMGPLKQVMQMLPMGKMGLKVSDDMYNVTQERMKKYKFIMDSMTDSELSDPKLMNSPRITRISRGSGTKYDEVRELLKYHKTMQKAMKGMMGGGKFNMQKMMKKFGI
ncbi:MAG: signal recognition particle protein Srp54 [Candidatus Methanoperedens sp.]|nr:signal recognition particle protein Srp54 [Candidatus Methanoperedens sp.]PKL52796.1 MAG: signal recognition particle protein Srp19 [Candidatus Methanoperedenaceae archaeon HGW-Methanoperedenaceae-1]